MSEHKYLSVTHLGFTIKITYWIGHDKDKKIVGWSVKDGGTKIEHTNFIREPLGGTRGFLWFGGRPERSFHSLIAEAIEKGAAVANEKVGETKPPDPEEIVSTLEIRGYDATPRRH